ncbi:putative transposase [Escherichia coli BCE034_MS-14]|nr:putative transposase [Escherichia coli BCE034_MS-14]
MFHNRWLLAEMSRIAADVILEICHQADVEPGIFTEPRQPGGCKSGCGRI